VTVLTHNSGLASDRPRAWPGRSRRGLDLLIQVSRAIGSIHDQASLMATIMRAVTEAFEAERSSLFLHDAKTHELWTRVAQGLEDWPERLAIPDDFGLCGRVFQTQESMCIDNAQASPFFAKSIAQRTGYVPQAMLLVPVREPNGGCIGVLQVMDRRIGFFSDEDLPILEAIAVQVGISLENARLYESQQRQFESFVKAFSAALDARDPLTAVHSVNVANYAMGIGEILGMSRKEIDWLRIAGLLHDVGKIGVPEAVLTKPGRLTPDEFEEMKRHAQYSRTILSKIEFMEELTGLDMIAAAHHEKLDGSGYPDALRGDEIPLKARILAVADIYDALTQTRHYRQGMTMHEALKVLSDMTPHQVDASCVGALKAFLGCGPWPMV
jgi:HD-GYP domain-containing protein (c-di-GMP phosphodiesterase class II)